MDFTNEQILYLSIGGVIVLAVAIILTRKVKFKIGKGGASLDTDKGIPQDDVDVRRVNKSSVDVANRVNQNVNVRDISNDSEIKIK